MNQSWIGKRKELRDEGLSAAPGALASPTASRPSRTALDVYVPHAVVGLRTSHLLHTTYDVALRISFRHADPRSGASPEISRTELSVANPSNSEAIKWEQHGVQRIPMHANHMNQSWIGKRKELRDEGLSVAPGALASPAFAMD
eukprot:CAMPEP_0196757284 /NCGR_PEP_ID=MMETSP1091-20130531/103587_1 /TAXON_ID=302021 /ORGANISM="Rhodomonas sp., Strain CCMP768" /LENGTH=143 /DNA_ID=CAMNT_0042106055 /DNA_START=280 /DNA_END=711 /DNA_ORIENTATION=+